MTNFYVTCAWCKSQFHQPTFSNCTNCGGALPISESNGGAGQQPPPAPRLLPKSFVKSVKYYNNVYTMIGIIFTVPFFWSIIFPIIGIFLWKKGLREAKGELMPLENGRVAEGTVTNIIHERSKKLNGKSPHIIEFVFNVGGQVYSGDVPNVMDPVQLWKKVGDKIWVVYMAEDPTIGSVWPPMK